MHFRDSALGLLVVFVVFSHACRSDERVRRRFGSNGMDVVRIYAALTEYATANGNLYPVPRSLVSSISASSSRLGTSTLKVLPSMTVSELRPHLEPKFIRRLPSKDDWGNPILCAVSSDGKHVTLILTGSNGRIEAFHPHSWRDDSDVSQDIVFSDGVFVSAPRLWEPRDWRPLSAR